MIGILVLTLIALLLSILLVVCDKLLSKTNIVDEIEKELPGYNCGACGFGSCHGMSEAILKDHDAYKKCRLLKNIKGVEKIIKSKLS